MVVGQLCACAPEPMTAERRPNGQFSGVARLSGLEMVLMVAIGSIFAVCIIFAVLMMAGRF